MSGNRIPYGRQHITQNDIDAVVAALSSDFLTQGPRISEFEENFAKYVGAKYAIALSNGTAALHLSSMALGVIPGQKVITSPITFVASANGPRYCGAEIVFADIDPDTYLLDINAVRKILESEPIGTFAGIIPVDFTGHAVDMEAFRLLANEFGLWIIEDAAHSPGGFFKDSNKNTQTCGNGKFADLTIFSFHPVKHIAAGEGGMITTNDENLYKRLNSLRTHGITNNPELLENNIEVAFMDEKPSNYPQEYPIWYMEMQHLGFNYRITDIQAALANSQLANAENGITRRREIAATYQKAFANQGFILGQSGIVEGHAYHLYVIEVPDRAALHLYLREHQIFAQIHYIPAHLMPYYKAQGYEQGDFPHAEKYYKHCISLPMFPSLKVEEQEFVIQTIFDFYKKINMKKELTFRIAQDSDYDDYYKIRAEKKNLFWTGYDNAPDYQNFKKWFSSRLLDDKRHLYLLFNGSECVSALHLDYYDDYAFLGYNVKEAHEGNGYGTYLVKKAKDIISQNPQIKSIKAWINFQNIGSMRVSEKNGFVKSDVTETRKRFGNDELYFQYIFNF